MKKVAGVAMMKMQKMSLLLCSLLLTSTVFADTNQWTGYKSVERPQKKYPTTTYKYTDQYGRPMSEEIPVRPQYQRPNPHYPPQHYPNYPDQGFPQQSYPDQGYPNRPYPISPPQNGVTIIYNHQFPTQTEYSGTSYGYVNGEGGRIESSQYTLISDWRRYGLPDPQVGMHWVFENGRYIQISNRR